MLGLSIVKPAENPVVSLDDMKNYLRVEINEDNDLIETLVAAAEECCEVFTYRSFIKKQYLLTLDSFPYFADTQLSQNAMPPSYYSLPMYSTSMWNYSQQIKLLRSPVASVDSLIYMSSADSQWHALLPSPPLWYPLTPVIDGAIFADNNGNQQKVITAGTTGANPPSPWNAELNGTTTDASGVVYQNIGPVPQQVPITGGSMGVQFGPFIVDTNTEPARLFPGPAGNYWPPVLYMPGAVQIRYTAGYGDEAEDVPSACVTAVMQAVSNWYENREPVSKDMNLPPVCKALLGPYRIMDQALTRG